MFGNKQESAAPVSTLDNLNKIVNGTLIEGNIKTETDLRIDGKVNGNIQTSGKLVQGSTSEIIGDILCVNANIEGFVRGNLMVKDVLRISKTANIDGNITTAKLIVDEGAIIQAKISMASANTSKATQPNPQKS